MLGTAQQMITIIVVIAIYWLKTFNWQHGQKKGPGTRARIQSFSGWCWLAKSSWIPLYLSALIHKWNWNLLELLWGSEEFKSQFGSCIFCKHPEVNLVVSHGSALKTKQCCLHFRYSCNTMSQFGENRFLSHKKGIKH